MITKIEITASGGLDLSNDIRKYLTKKIGRLDRLMTKQARRTVFAEVKLKQETAKKRDKMTAEVVLKMPGETLVAKDSTMNIYAAIDIVEAKLKNQLRRYKQKHGAPAKKTDRKKVLKKLRSLADRDYWGSQN